MLLKVRWFSWGVSISNVSENAILATLLSALSSGLAQLDISGEQRQHIQAIDTLADQGMMDAG